MLFSRRPLISVMGCQQFRARSAVTDPSDSPPLPANTATVCSGQLKCIICPGESSVKKMISQSQTTSYRSFPAVVTGPGPPGLLFCVSSRCRRQDVSRRSGCVPSPFAGITRAGWSRVADAENRQGIKVEERPAAVVHSDRKPRRSAGAWRNPPSAADVCETIPEKSCRAVHSDS